MRHAPVQRRKKMTVSASKSRQRTLSLRSAAQLRIWQRRMKSMTQRARHVVTFALMGILCFQVPAQSFAQVGQNAMSQPVGVANGVVNRGLGALGSLNDAGPGFFYYGVNEGHLF